MANRLAGAGPAPGGGGNNDGPSPAMTGTLGIAPQAAPQQGAMPGQNMLGASPQAPQPQQGGMPGQPQAPVVPPSKELLMEAIHKQSVVTAHLKALLSKPDLKTKDILTAVGQVVADGVMSPFDAPKYLKDLPGPDPTPLELRKWVAQHYARASQALQTVASMIGAHGEMVRRQQAAPPEPMMGNRFSQAPAPPQQPNPMMAPQ